MDFQKLIEQFKDTEDVKFVELVRKFSRSPDEHFYEILTNQGTFFVFEVDYIGNFEQDVVEVVKTEVGKYAQMYEVNSNLEFEQSNPVKAANVYRKPQTWDTVSIYANEKFGSKPYYFNFLVKK